MTKRVAKLVMIDDQDKYLLMYRSNHPLFGTDADIPGGIVEEEESVRDGVIREVFEETGVEVAEVEELYTGDPAAGQGTHKVVFAARFAQRPEITMSWEHSSYEWVDREEFLSRARHANDSYMHVVYDVLQHLPVQK